MKRLLLVIALIIIPEISFAAISANAVWDIRSTATANNVNGCFFVTGASGTDYSKQDAAQYALTGVTSAGAGNTILTASAAADMVGNGIHTVSGSNFTNNSWFEITSVVVGVSITVSTNSAGTSIATGVGASGVMNVGGSCSLNSTLDDDMFESATAGNTFYIKNGSLTLGENVSIALNGTAPAPIKILGYNSTQGDSPTGTSRPTINTGTSFSLVTGNFYILKNLIFTGSNAPVISLGNNNVAYNVKATNTSTTAGRSAFSIGGLNIIDSCEAISYRGNAFNSGSGNSWTIRNSWGHDSDIGLLGTSSGVQTVFNNLFNSNVTAAISETSPVASTHTYLSNTLYGFDTPTGTGISFGSGASSPSVENNIIYGFTTGVSHTVSMSSGFDNWNDYYNNTNDVSSAAQWQKGPDDKALNPGFLNVTQLVNVGTVTSSTNILTDTGADFSNVVDGRDYIYIVSGTGTGFTTGIYAISAHTTTTLTVSSNITSAGSGSSIVYRMTLGRNFNVGQNLKGYASPGASFQGGYTTSYRTIGAAEPANSGTSSSSGFLIS